MGLRRGGEKPATVLQIVYGLGWLPALLTVWPLRHPGGPVAVVSDAGGAGARAALGLAVSLAVLTAAYLAALRRPPGSRGLAAACAVGALGALALPALFSADVYAYASYGDLALRGLDPYGHGGAPAGDALAAAAAAAWDGHVPPRCVYGPLAVALAAAADLAGTAAGVAGQVAAQRIAALVAYAAYVAAVMRLTSDRRARAVATLHPAIVWSVGEGHNDAAMVALAAASIAAPRGATALAILAGWVKAPALLLLRRVPRRATIGAATVALAGYVPLAVALAAGMRDAGAAGASPAAWQSPLGLLAAAIGRPGAVAVAAAALVAVGAAARRLPPAERTAVIAFAAWYALPNAYPWYAWWIVPLAARRIASPWSWALLAAALFAPARAAIDAIFPAATTFADPRTFHTGMIALEFTPPLVILAVSGVRASRAAAAAAAVAALLWLAPASASAHASFAPASPAPAPAPQPQPQPAAAGPVSPGPMPSAPSPTPLPAPSPAGAPPSGPAPSAPLPAPTGAPSPQPTGAPSPQPTGAPSPQPPSGAPSAPGTPLAAPGALGASPTPSTATPVPPTPNPFSYVITPAPVPATSPDGPHIIEVLLNDRRIHAGGPLVVRVLTSPNVVGVEARALGRFIAIPQSSPGLFSLAYTMPGGIPFWLLNKNYDIVIAAATADGRQTTVSFPMLLTR